MRLYWEPHETTPRAIAAEMDRLGVRVSVLNAGDGQHEHPSQGLLDLFTICSLIDPENPRLELLKNKKIAIVGDILHSRVARSNNLEFNRKWRPSASSSTTYFITSIICRLCQG